MAWFQPKPLTVPDIIALNAEFLNAKTAWVDGERRESWRAFGTGTARVANALAEGDSPAVAEPEHAIEVWRRAGFEAMQIGAHYVERGA